jgi:ATP-binding cassette subfamily F protein 3
MSSRTFRSSWATASARRLVGPNGAGKSTLLKLRRRREAGRRLLRRRGGTGYLRQEAGHDAARPLAEEMWTAFPEVRAVDRALHEVAGRIERGDGDIDALIAEQGELFERFEALDGYRIDAHIGRVLDGLGFEPGDRQKLCGDFSGGWQMRIALAKILVRRPEHVLLDEPTTTSMSRRAHSWPMSYRNTRHRADRRTMRRSSTVWPHAS